MWMNLKIIFKDLDPVSYATHSDTELSLDSIKSHMIPIGKAWKLVTRCSNLDEPQKWNELGQTQACQVPWKNGDNTQQWLYNS